VDEVDAVVNKGKEGYKSLAIVFQRDEAKVILKVHRVLREEGSHAVGLLRHTTNDHAYIAWPHNVLVIYEEPETT
jgi:hypothetical protein